MAGTVCVSEDMYWIKELLLGWMCVIMFMVTVELRIGHRAFFSEMAVIFHIRLLHKHINLEF